MKAKITITGEPQRAFAIQQLREVPLLPVHTVEIKEKKTTRNLMQNARIYAMLTDISRDVVWYGQKLTVLEWKDVFTASLKKQKVVAGLDGVFVVCGSHTSTMSTSEAAELIELMMAFGCQHGVKWRDPQYEE